MSNIGDNLPPESTPIQARLNESYQTLAARRDQLLDAMERVPEDIKDEELAGKAGDFTKQISAAIKDATAGRVKEKEFFLEGGRQVDGWFKQVIEPLDEAKKAVLARLTDYQKGKEAQERKEREHAEKLAREEAARLERIALEAAEAVKNEESLVSAVGAEEAAKAAHQAQQAAGREAHAKAAELSRTRGQHGSVASLRSKWTGEITDRAILDLNALRQHIHEEALQKAIRSFVKAGGRELTGARIWENHSTAVR